MSKAYENPKQVNTKRLIPKHIIVKKTNVLLIYISVFVPVP